MKSKTPFICFSLVCLLTSLITVRPAYKAQQPARSPDQLRTTQIQRATAMSATVRRMRRLLLENNVPFEPSILFARNWRTRLAPYLAQMPQMTRTLRVPTRFRGLKIANIVHLPSKVELTGDTVILARHLVFAGKHIEISGHNDLLVFPIESALSEVDPTHARSNKTRGTAVKISFASGKALDRARQEGLLVEPETVQINLDGLGRDQWLEQHKLRKADTFGHHSRPSQSTDAAPGATGRQGDDGLPGLSPVQADTGAAGNCAASPDGSRGHTGLPATPAGAGLEGGRGVDGDDAGTLHWTIMGTTGSYHFSARGGRGGEGGRGGSGGFGARGGEGGRGGPGAVCPCPARSGNGGPGGQGAQGGQGGDGGPGGSGGNGGNGGTINLSIPCDFVGNYTTNVARGGLGPGGQPGSLSAGGPGGFGSPGGNGASNTGCLSQGGSNGPRGGDGPPGLPGALNGTRGSDGERGQRDGTVDRSYTGNCGGGGGDAYLEPGIADDYCTPWYWVWYHCEYYNARHDGPSTRGVNRRTSWTAADRWSIGLNLYTSANTAASSGLLLGWECYEVTRQYAGCW